MNDLYLIHHGVKGQRWGIRRYQNPDGTLTDLGKKRYAKEIKKRIKSNDRELPQTKRYSKYFDNLDERLLNDSKLKALSKKAYDLEYRKTMLEKDVIDDEDKYSELISSDKYLNLDAESQKAHEEKSKRIEELEQKWTEEYRNIVLDDLNIHESENRKIAYDVLRKAGYTVYVQDLNYEWNPDNFYEPGHEDRKFEYSSKNLYVW